MMDKNFIRYAFYVILASCITFGQFALIPLFSRQQLPESDLESLSPVRFLRFDNHQEPPPASWPEEKQKPKPPEELLKQSISLALKPEIDVPRLDFEINPKLDSGLLISADKLDGIYYELGEVDTRPIEISQVQPIYPPRARQLGVTGSVMAQFIINTAGKAERIKIISATPPGYFENAVIDAIKLSKFRPAVLDGEPVAVKVSKPYDFN